MQKKRTTRRTLKGEDPEPDQPAAEVKGMIPYPCCPKESVLVYAEAHGRCSQKCPCCGRFAVFDYDNMTAKPSRPRRGATEQYRFAHE